MFKVISRGVTRVKNQQFQAILATHSLDVASTRQRSGLPFNTVMLFVPQQEAWIIERFGKYHRLLDPGLNFLLPFVDTIKYVQSLKELAIDIPHQSAISIDNVTLQIDGVLYLRVADPYKASYGVEDAEYAITQLAQTTMRSEIGKIQLDTVFRDRETLNVAIVDSINKASQAWGIRCLRYEIRDIKVPDRIQDAMQMQVEAERRKRAAILESEGIRASEINLAEGKKTARILQSEAVKTEHINQAVGEAQALINKAQARARSIDLVANSLQQKNAMNAVSMNVAEHYIAAFGNLAKQNNTILLPTNTGDISHMVTQAMSIYKSMSDPTQGGTGPNPAPTTSFTPEQFPVGSSDEWITPSERVRSSEHVTSPTLNPLDDIQEQIQEGRPLSLQQNRPPPDRK